MARLVPCSALHQHRNSFRSRARRGSRRSPSSPPQNDLRVPIRWSPSKFTSFLHLFTGILNSCHSQSIVDACSLWKTEGWQLLPPLLLSLHGSLGQLLKSYPKSLPLQSPTSSQISSLRHLARACSNSNELVELGLLTLSEQRDLALLPDRISCPGTPDLVALRERLALEQTVPWHCCEWGVEEGLRGSRTTCVQVRRDEEMLACGRVSLSLSLLQYHPSNSS